MSIRSTTSKIVGIIAGAFLLVGGGLGVSGALPFQDIASTNANEAADDRGRPDDLPDVASLQANGDVEVESNGDGPDENASDTAHAVHEAREAALALEDAPPCAVGVYVSTAATNGEFNESDVPDQADWPCANGEDNGVTVQEQTTGDDQSQEGRDRAAEAQNNAGTETQGTESQDTAPQGAGSQGDVDDDGEPGQSGPPDGVPPGS